MKRLILTTLWLTPVALTPLAISSLQAQEAGPAQPAPVVTQPPVEQPKAEQPQVERLVSGQPKLVNRLETSSGTGPAAPASPAVAPSVTTQNAEVQPADGPLTLEESIRIALENHGDVGV